MASKSSKKRIPAPVVARLTQYLAHARRLRQSDVRWVASREVAHALGLTSSTVRQDLSHIDFSGRSKRGYETRRLVSALCRDLGIGKAANVAVVGAGNLGRALAQHAGFEREGFPVVALFDCDRHLIGKKVGGLVIEGMGKLSTIVAGRRIVLAMLAVPMASAQRVTDQLICAGVRGILNLTTAHVRVPSQTVVLESRIVSRLQELQYLVMRKAQVCD